MRGTEVDEVRVIYIFAATIATIPVLLLEEQVIASISILGPLYIQGHTTIHTNGLTIPQAFYKAPCIHIPFNFYNTSEESIISSIFHQKCREVE